MKRLGVIGGLGPMATAYFMELIVKMTDVLDDQEHIEMIVHSCPSIPDRTNYILSQKGESPACKMIEIGKELDDMLVDCIAIPCITAHYFHSPLVEEIQAPIIHLINEVVEYLKVRKYRCIGLMATDGTVKSGIFQDALEGCGIKVVLPDVEEQAMVMHLIYDNVKANVEVDMSSFNEVSSGLKARGAEVVILGCTELSMVKKEHEIGPGFLDAMEVLAMLAIKSCDKPIKAEYKELITKEYHELIACEYQEIV